MLRLLELAQELTTDGTLKSIAYRDITEAEIFEATEMLIVGTTLNLVAVREYEGRTIGTGRPGPIYARLGEMLVNDIDTNAELRVPLF